MTNELHDDNAARLTRAIRDAFQPHFPSADISVSLGEEQIRVHVRFNDETRVPETWTYDVLGEDDEVLVFRGGRRRSISIERPEGV